jgi:DNA-binding response OmpR family regulator
LDTPHVLVVEDEVFIQLQMESTLEEGGFKVILARTGERAIQVLDAQKPPICALITDVNLGPGMSGWEVAKHAREIPVIYVTGHGGEEWASHGLPKTILISKPFAAAQLLTAVSNRLNGSP